MADHPVGPGPGEPSPLPEGEFRSNFFETMKGPEQGRPAAARPEASNAFPPPPESPRRHPVFPIILGAGFIAAIVSAIVSSAMPHSASTGTEPAAAAAPDQGPKEGLAREAELKALADDLKGQIADLSKQVKALDERVDGTAKPAQVVDLGPLNAKVAALAKSVDAVGPLSKKVDALDERLNRLDTSVKSVQDGTSTLRNDLTALRTDLDNAKKRGAGEGDNTAATDAAKPVNVNVEGQSFAQGVALFRAGKFRDASRVFRTTEDNDPKDARVWYYAALSTGLATQQWLGDTQRLVMKGVEREKAGTPSKDEIDAEFSKLPAAQRNWLDAYRKLAQQ